MSAASNYLEHKLVDHIFRGQTFTKPTSLWVGLCTAAPDDSSIGTEVSGNNYARVEVACSLSTWLATQGSTSPAVASSGTGGLTSNAAAVTFPTPSGDWGTVTHWIICDTDGSPAGNLLFWGALSASKTIQSGDDVAFVAGALQITVG